MLSLLGYLLYYGASLYIAVLVARVVFDWARVLAPRWQPRGIILVLGNFVYALTDPPILWLRRFIPPLRLGSIALDVGFVILFVGVSFVARLGAYLVFLGAAG